MILIFDASSAVTWQLTFRLLESKHQAKRETLVSCLIFRQNDPSESRTFLQQNIEGFPELQENSIVSSAFQLVDHHCKGALQSRGKKVQWDFYLSPPSDNRYLGPLDRKKNTTQFESLTDGWTASGSVAISSVDSSNDPESISKTTSWNSFPVLITHKSGQKPWTEWIWAPSQTLQLEPASVNPAALRPQGSSQQLQFEIQGRRVPLIGSFFTCRFFYRDQWHTLNRWRDQLKIKTQWKEHTLEFKAEKGAYLFVGEIQSEAIRLTSTLDITPLGGVSYREITPSARAKVTVYRQGKLEGIYSSSFATPLLRGSRKKNPYVEQISY